MFRDCLLVGLGAWLLAVPLAWVAHAAQHEFLSTPYLLLPINLTSFYFLPLFAFGLFAIATRQNRRSTTLTWGLILALVFTTGRVLYWWTAARDLTENPGPGRFEARASTPTQADLVIGGLGLASYVALAIGMWRLIAPRQSRPE